MLGGVSRLLWAKAMWCKVPSAGGARSVFENVDFEISTGEIVDLVGPSGAGKSSLLTALARLNPHAGGDMGLEERAAESFSPQQWRREVSYLPQKPVLPGSSVTEAIRLPFTFALRKGESAPDDQAIRETLDRMGCGDVELTRDPHDLSGGQAARVSLARTLLTQPKVLLADEVDAGLDDANAELVADALARAAHEQGMAVVRIRHRPPDGRAHRIMRLEDGRLSEVAMRGKDNGTRDAAPSSSAQSVPTRSENNADTPQANREAAR